MAEAAMTGMAEEMTVMAIAAGMTEETAEEMIVTAITAEMTGAELLP